MGGGWRDREREKEKERERARERECVRVLFSCSTCVRGMKGKRGKERGGGR